MANAPIIKPRAWKAKSPNVSIGTRSAKADGSNSFSAGQFVKLSSGELAAYVADDTAIHGLVLDASHTATDEPFNALYGQNHNVVDPATCYFLMNITDGSGSEGSGSTTHADVAIGTLYSARYGATSTTTLMLDASDSGTAGKNIFKVVGLYNTQIAADGDASADKNGRVIVEILTAGVA